MDPRLQSTRQHCPRYLACRTPMSPPHYHDPSPPLCPALTPYFFYFYFIFSTLLLYHAVLTLPPILTLYLRPLSPFFLEGKGVMLTQTDYYIETFTTAGRVLYLCIPTYTYMYRM